MNTDLYGYPIVKGDLVVTSDGQVAKVKTINPGSGYCGLEVPIDRGLWTAPTFVEPPTFTAYYVAGLRHLGKWLSLGRPALKVT